MAEREALISASCVLGRPNDPKLEDVYLVGEQLGKGAFGIVRLATTKSDGQKFAVKSISKAKLVCKEDIRDVLNEIAMMNLVAGHPNVVAVKSTHEDSDHVHIVMELCAGRELFESIVKSGSFTEKKAAGVFRKMVEVVHHCQELGVMHRDLKPENFLLTSTEPDADLKLTDFGLGTFFRPGQRFSDLVGSPYYVAPEVLRKDYGREADLWSLGVILYILLSGLPPFWGDNEEQIFKMVLRGHIDFKTDPWPTISDAAKNCIFRLLEQDPAKRATSREILQHEWLVKEGVALDVPLDHVVLSRMRQFGQMNKLKKMCMMVVGTHLSLEEIAGLKELFTGIDADCNGTISVAEMRNAVVQLGTKINEVEMGNLLSIADVDGDGLLDYNEFVACTMHMSKLEKEELLQKAFKQLDKDGSGTIDAAELAQALKQYNIFGANELELLQSADINGDGQVDYQEFAHMLRSQNAALRESRNVKSTILRY